MSEDITEDDMFTNQPAMPYGGSDRGPKSPQANRSFSARRQNLLMVLLADSGPSGATAKEAVEYLKQNGDPSAYHGNTSGALSVLHKEGRISRLTMRRSRFFVYVLPEHVEGRETQAHGSVSTKGQAVLGFKTKVDSSGADAALARVQAQLDDMKKTNEVLKYRVTDVTNDNQSLVSANDSLASENRDLKEAGLALQQRLGDAERKSAEAEALAERLSGEISLHVVELSDLQVELDQLTDAKDYTDRALLNMTDEKDSNLNLYMEVQEELSTVKATAEELTQELLRANGRIGELQTEIDRLEQENISVTDSQPSRPPKSLTADEQALVAAVAKALAKSSDGTADKPTVKPTRVSTLRTLVNALVRVTSVD